MLPRSEYPRPQFAREGWMTLNGSWQFEIDFGASGKERKFYERDDFEKEITVPFCPESKLSGIGYTVVHHKVRDLVYEGLKAE